jgi:hypothetical protein
LPEKPDRHDFIPPRNGTACESRRAQLLGAAVVALFHEPAHGKRVAFGAADDAGTLDEPVHHVEVSADRDRVHESCIKAVKTRPSMPKPSATRECTPKQKRQLFSPETYAAISSRSPALNGEGPRIRCSP